MNRCVEWEVIVHVNLSKIRIMLHDGKSINFYTYSHIVSLVHNQWRSWKLAIDIDHLSRNAIGGSKIPGQIEIVVDLGSLGNPCYTEPETCWGHGCDNFVRKSRWILWICRYVHEQNPILWGSVSLLMFIHLLRWLLLMHPERPWVLNQDITWKQNGSHPGVGCWRLVCWPMHSFSGTFLDQDWPTQLPLSTVSMDCQINQHVKLCFQSVMHWRTWSSEIMIQFGPCCLQVLGLPLTLDPSSLFLV